MPVTRVALLASSPVVRAGLETLLGERGGLVVVGAGGVGTGADAVETAFDRVAGWEADVVVWVLDAAGREPVATLLRRAGVETPARAEPPVEGGELLPPAGVGREGVEAPAVVLLVERGDGAADPVAALRAGARAVLPSDVSGVTLGLAVEAAAAGLTLLPPDAATVLLADRAPVGRDRPAPVVAARAPGLDRIPSLSGREREVLALLAEGLPNKVIAPRLGISEHTVKAHVAAVFEKLGAGTRAEAVVTAARLGLLML